MALPIAPVVLPADLAGQPNGQLPESLLVSVGRAGKLHHLAARAFVALSAAAWEVGLPLTYTYGGTYRTISMQEVLWDSRYAIGGNCGGCKTCRGRSYCKKPDPKTGRCPATAACPGTSNHGIGLAIDTAFDFDLTDGIGPDDAAAITGHPQWPWFLANAPRFGFSWELESEPWHIRYVAGDNIPAAVLEFENPTPNPDPIPPINPPVQEDDDMLFIAKPTFPGATNATSWLTYWKNPGSGPRASRTVGAHIEAANLLGVPIVPMNSPEHHAYECKLYGIPQSV
jgi:LAS superfamily LD-carboxypeptidase LdcB